MCAIQYDSIYDSLYFYFCWSGTVTKIEHGVLISCVFSSAVFAFIVRVLQSGSSRHVDRRRYTLGAAAAVIPLPLKFNFREFSDGSFLAVSTLILVLVFKVNQSYSISISHFFCLSCPNKYSVKLITEWGDRRNYNYP